MKTSKTTKHAFELSNLRQIKVSYIGATNTRGSRVCISEPNRSNQEPTQKKYFSYSYKYGDIMEQAYNLLKFNGWNIICRASDSKGYIFLCDNWSDEFLEIKNLKTN
tara:strand:+ start:26 stop:346 length:321 start_codon:yes stop_codon:yes gene_type:complete